MWSSLSEIIRTRVCVLRLLQLLFKGGVYFVQELLIVLRPFEEIQKGHLVHESGPLTESQVYIILPLK